MQIREWLICSVAGLCISGCAGIPGGASPETRTALAPTGKLRVAFLSAPIYATRDPATGELKGVAVDLGNELARRVGVPFHPVPYPNPPALIGGAKSGEWDVALVGINAERATTMDFSAPYMEVEQGFLVRIGVPIATASNVDEAGIRIGVLEKAGADTQLSRTLKSATLVRTASLPELFTLFGTGKVDVIAATKTSLYVEAAKQPGARVLEGRILIDPIGIGVPKGRDSAGSAFVAKFVEEAKSGGLVKSAIEQAGLRGVVVAPLN